MFNLILAFLIVYGIVKAANKDFEHSEDYYTTYDSKDQS